MLCATGLLSGGEVTLAPVGFERRESVGLDDLDFDAAEFAVARGIGGRVANEVFVAQLDADLHGDVGQIVEAGGEMAAAGGF